MANWHVGFTAFGGPAVQFQTVSRSYESERIFERVNTDIVPREVCNSPGLDR